MPLASGPGSFQPNVRTLMGEIGKSPHVQSRQQALAIAYAKERGKADGGSVQPEPEPPKSPQDNYDEMIAKALEHNAKNFAYLTKLRPAPGGAYPQQQAVHRQGGGGAPAPAAPQANPGFGAPGAWTPQGAQGFLPYLQAIAQRGGMQWPGGMQGGGQQYSFLPYLQAMMARGAQPQQRAPGGIVNHDADPDLPPHPTHEDGPAQLVRLGEGPAALPPGYLQLLHFLAQQQRALNAARNV